MSAEAERQAINKRLDLVRLLNRLTFGGISITNKRKGDPISISNNPTIGDLIIDPDGARKIDEEIRDYETLLDVDTDLGKYKQKKRRPRTADKDLQDKLGLR